MGNGAFQDIITVKNPTSKKYYQARVVAPGEVVVAY
jgi:flagella basal body P-ring formation protein FlgA